MMKLDKNLVTNNKKKTSLNLLILGNADVGKSTTIGNLVYNLGNFNGSIIKSMENDSPKLGTKKTINYVRFLDKLKSDIEKGVNYETIKYKFETKNYNVTIIDSPGHRDFVKNMITGTIKADVALLIVSAKNNEFELGFRNGSTREQALLAYTIGIKYLIIGINKIDITTPCFDQERFDKIVTIVKGFLLKIGYQEKNIIFIPYLACETVNIIKNNGYNNGDKGNGDNKALSWFEGPTLTDAIDLFDKNQYLLLDKPLRIPIQDMYSIGEIGTVIVGKIESGVLKKGMNLTIGPKDLKSECIYLEKENKTIKEAFPGDVIGFNINNVKIRDLRRGHMCGDSNNDPPKDTLHFDALVVSLISDRIKNGYTPVIDCHLGHIACKFDKIMQTIDRRTGKGLEFEPKEIKSGDVAIVRMIPMKPLVVESYVDYPYLGRFEIKDMNFTVGVGIIKSVVKKEKENK